MTHYKLAFLGFGNVGKALAKLLFEKQGELSQRYQITFSVTGIATGHHGMLVNSQGIDLDKILKSLQADPTNFLRSLPGEFLPADGREFIQTCGAEVLFENTPVNYENGQPAIDYIELALTKGMHVITANKGPVVHAYQHLVELAASKGVKFLFESTVMDGAPIFSLFRNSIPAAKLKSFRGIFNSTTNMILTLMEQGKTFEEAVTYAQEIGIAETDPSGDIDGWDAAVKVAALVTVIMGIPMKPQQVDRQGIRSLLKVDVQAAFQEGKRWKLICAASREGDQVTAFVRPELVSQSSPLYMVQGTTSIAQFETDVLGLLSIIEENPGPHTTAYGCLADFVNAVTAT